MNIIAKAYLRGYRVDEDGCVIGFKETSIGCCNNSGYISFGFREGKKSSHILIHRLQAYQKYGDEMFKLGIEVRHLNGDKTDNSWFNIAIGTHSENMMDIPKHIRVSKAVYATSFVRKHNRTEIKEYHKKHRSYKKTMEKFSISSKGTLHFILNGNNLN